MLEREIENILEQKLRNNGWNIDVGKKNRNVYRQNPKTQEQVEKLQGGHPDFILYSNEKDTSPTAIIEVKRNSHKNIIDAEKQAIKYAKKLNAPIIFIFNSNYFITKFLPNNKPLKYNEKTVNDMLSPDILLKYKQKKTNNISTNYNTIIKSKNDLINVFKYVNNKLRDAGISKGVNRFSEFANLLFLKQISEKQKTGGEIDIPKYVLWDSFSDKTGDELLHYINDTIIPIINQFYSSDTQYPIFTKLEIKDTVKLKEIIDKMSTLQLQGIDSDIKGDAFEYFIEKYNSGNNDLDEYFTPRHLVKFLIHISNPKFNEKIYDPFCGTGGILIAAFSKILSDLKNKKMLNEQTILFLKQKSLYGSEISPTARIAKMNMILTGDGHSNVKQQDTFINPINQKFDVIATNIPFNLTVTNDSNYKIITHNGNSQAIQHILKALKSNGRAAVIVPESILTNNDLSSLRKYIVETGMLKGIISLPSKVFLPYTEAKTSILILGGANTPKLNKIFFYKVKNDGFTLTTRRRQIDGINDLDEFISINEQMLNQNYGVEIKNNSIDYIDRNLILKNKNKLLSSFFYLNIEQKNHIFLSKIIKQIHIDNKKLFKTATITKNSFWGVELGSNFWGSSFTSVTSAKNYDYRVLENKMIAYNPSRANVGSFGININKEPVAVSKAYETFKVFNKDYLPEYIYLLLTKNEEILQEIITRSYGAVRQALHFSDLQSIQIKKITLEKQKEIVKKTKQKYNAFVKSKENLDKFFI